MPRRKSIFKITKPKVKLTKKGVKVTRPRASIGNKVKLNLSSKGVSSSVKTPLGTYNTRKGLSRKGLFGIGRKPSRKASGCPLAVLPLFLLLIGAALLIQAL